MVGRWLAPMSARNPPECRLERSAWKCRPRSSSRPVVALPYNRSRYCQSRGPHAHDGQRSDACLRGAPSAGRPRRATFKPKRGAAQDHARPESPHRREDTEQLYAKMPTARSRVGLLEKKSGLSRIRRCSRVYDATSVAVRPQRGGRARAARCWVCAGPRVVGRLTGRPQCHGHFIPLIGRPNRSVVP
jgi:hypothetical protein